MRFDKAEAIGAKAGEEIASLIPGSGDDWLGRANSLVSNFRELLALALKVKGLQDDFGPGKEASNPAPGSSPFTQAAKQFLASPYADIPIGKLLEQLSPYTIRQVMEMAKNARP